MMEREDGTLTHCTLKRVHWTKRSGNNVLYFLRVARWRNGTTSDL